MKIKHYKKVEETRIVDTPSFYRLSEWEVIAIFDENNIVMVYETDDLKIINNKTSTLFNDWDKLSDDNIISEGEFMEKHNRVHASLSLTPTLV